MRDKYMDARGVASIKNVIEQYVGSNLRRVHSREGSISACEVKHDSAGT